MKAVIDTNVLVYRAIKDSKNHIKALNIMNKLEEWIVPPIVIHELVLVLSELLSMKEALEFTKALLNNRKTKIPSENGEDLKWAINTLCREKISVLRLNDKIILYTALKHEIPLLSFDKQALSQASRLGVAQINPYT